MSATATKEPSTKDADPKKTNPKAAGGPAALVPPEEQFWKRYSPHGEAPISLAGSFMMHVMLAGGALFFAAYLASYFMPTPNLPIEAVRLGGGGGKVGGVGDGKGIGSGVAAPVEDVPKENVPQPGDVEAPPKVELNPVEAKKIEQTFNADDARYIQDAKSASAKAFAGLEDKLRRKLADGLQPGKGEGGTGSGGGKGTGTGTGYGSGAGSGRDKLNAREKRMLRWHMRFTAATGPEYLAQLRDLKAILAFPVTEGDDPTYKTVRDLKRGGTLLDEDVAKLQRIYWIDDSPKSVEDILAALGLRMPKRPSRFVAFMPQELEAQLYKMERDYVVNILRREFNEDKIDDTQFKVVRGPSGYQAELVSVAMRN